MLDTNMISELRKGRKCNPNVAVWISAKSAESMFLSAITILELERGILLLERKDIVQGTLLRDWLTDYVFKEFAGRILPIDTNVAIMAAQLHVTQPSSRARRLDRGDSPFS